ncbi:MAG: N-acetyltransferase family protein [Sphingobium sp.]
MAALKLRTFRETFVEGPMALAYPDDDLAVFEEESYSPATIRAELADPRRRQWVAEDESGDLIGYAHVGPCKLPHPDANGQDGEIYQLYIADEWQGTGVGRRLMQTALDWMKDHMPGPVWLGVFSGNLRAQAIYVSRGFVKVGEYDYKVGTHRDREFIMKRDLR